jgi:hypothetical protein
LRDVGFQGFRVRVSGGCQDVRVFGAGRKVSSFRVLIYRVLRVGVFGC